MRLTWHFLSAPLASFCLTTLPACGDDAGSIAPDGALDVGAEVGSEVGPGDGDGIDADAVTPTRPLRRHDVSVLFPLPSAAAADALWPASLAGRGGPLVAETAFADIALSLQRELPETDEYAALRVVALRLDPCFQVRLDAPCQAQLRLVFQAIDRSVDDLGAYDGAIHALYNIAPADVTKWRDEVLELASHAPENDTDLALGTSPALVAQGLDGAYAQALRAFVVRWAGPESLARLTFMTRTDARSGQWQFGGFHFGSWPASEFPPAGRIAIVGTPSATLQTVTRTVGFGFRYGLDPLFAEPAGVPGLDSDALDTMDAAARAGIHAWAVAQEDPTARLADTTDCASCHLAGHIARHLEGLDPALVTPALAAARGPRRVGPAESNGDNLRAFGWFGRDPQVSQRAANETEAVLRAFAAER